MIFCDGLVEHQMRAICHTAQVLGMEVKDVAEASKDKGAWSEMMAAVCQIENDYTGKQLAEKLTNQFGEL